MTINPFIDVTDPQDDPNVSFYDFILNQVDSPAEVTRPAFIDDRPIWERIRDQKVETEAIRELDRLSTEIIDCQLDGVQDDDPGYQDTLTRFWALHNEWAI